jgi:hypothetical protein
MAVPEEWDIEGGESGGATVRIIGGNHLTDGRQVVAAWPQEIAMRFRNAQTPLEKEQVAEEMVRLAVETKGACLLR